MLACLAQLGWIALPAHAADDAEVTLAGRLGGTYDSFIEEYGEPYAEEQDPLFVIDDYGFVAVQSTALTTNDEAKRVRVITISSSRPLDLPANEPDSNDWSPDEAAERTLAFLPRDVELGEFEDGASGDLTATCQSDALQAIFGVLTLGQCRVNLILSGEETVSFATMTLTAGALLEETPEPEADPCEGALEWIKSTGERLTRTEALLGTIAEIDEADPDAPAQLREIAQGFRDLASEQREIDPPSSAARAAYYVISALNTYASALDGAADGVETADQATIDAALEDLDAANDAVSRANGEIEKAAEECNLELGTPVAS